MWGAKQVGQNDIIFWDMMFLENVDRFDYGVSSGHDRVPENNSRSVITDSCMRFVTQF